MRSNNCEPASSYKYFAGTRFGVVLKPSRTSVPNAEASVICGCGREERASATILPLVSFVSFIAQDLSENRFPLFGIVRAPACIADLRFDFGLRLRLRLRLRSILRWIERSRRATIAALRANPDGDFVFRFAFVFVAICFSSPFRPCIKSCVSSSGHSCL